MNFKGRGAVGATYHTPYAHWGHAVYADGEDTEVVINGGTITKL